MLGHSSQGLLNFLNLFPLLDSLGRLAQAQPRLLGWCVSCGSRTSNSVVSTQLFPFPCLQVDLLLPLLGHLLDDLDPVGTCRSPAGWHTRVLASRACLAACITAPSISLLMPEPAGITRWLQCRTLLPHSADRWRFPCCNRVYRPGHWRAPPYK